MKHVGVTNCRYHLLALLRGVADRLSNYSKWKEVAGRIITTGF
jgi:hypothetical protein